MKIAISNIAWEKLEDNRVANLLHKYNVQGVEIAPTKIWDNPINTSDDDIRRYAKFWTDQNIQVVATQSILFGHPELTIFQDELARSKTLEYLKQMIRVSAVLGAKVIVFGSPKNRVISDLDQGSAMDVAIDFFMQLGEIAKQYNVFFCIEPNAKEYGTDFITNTDEGINFVKAVDHPNFRLHLDSGVMTINKENYAESIVKALPYLCHFHISEPFLKLTGTKGTDHQSIASALKSVNYTSWVSIEMKNNLLDNNAHAVEQSLKFVTSIYQ